MCPFLNAEFKTLSTRSCYIDLAEQNRPHWTIEVNVLLSWVGRGGAISKRFCLLENLSSSEQAVC